MFSVFELAVLWEDTRRDANAARLIRYLALRTFFLALAVVSSDLMVLLIASEGISLFAYLIMRF